MSPRALLFPFVHPFEAPGIRRATDYRTIQNVTRPPMRAIFTGGGNLAGGLAHSILIEKDTRI
jgi:hypothetical protein